VGWDIVNEPVLGVEEALDNGLLPEEGEESELFAAVIGGDIVRWHLGGDVDKAIWAARIAFRLDSRSYQTLNNLAYVQLARGRALEECKDLLNSAIEIGNKGKRAVISHLNLGVLHALNGALEKASDEFVAVTMMPEAVDEGIARCLLIVPPRPAFGAHELVELLDVRVIDVARLNAASVAVARGDGAEATRYLAEMPTEANARLSEQVEKLRTIVNQDFTGSES